MVYVLVAVTHPSTNPARRKVTLDETHYRYAMPCFNSSQAGQHSLSLPNQECETMSLIERLGIYSDDLPVQGQSSIKVLTRPDVGQLHWTNITHDPCHTILAVCFTDCLHVFVERPAQVKCCEIVLAQVKVSYAEIIIVHCCRIAQRTTCRGPSGWVENMGCSRTQYPHCLLIVPSTVLKLTLQKHCRYCLHMVGKNKHIKSCCLLRWQRKWLGLKKLTINLKINQLKHFNEFKFD